ncbi:hypothetical protein GUJ93_ZPchr0012g20693 [Zizania palustris]|uniref:Zinc finger LSD1-type domain-containing protein n=1 Tax=Zizania palustris TaxID=103762 RepID=A0A8J5WJP1_ZIZPA|nr:hypothetical protein GUJ93_ZPchr0012g20693 [Zizania palustris]
MRGPGPRGSTNTISPLVIETKKERRGVRTTGRLPPSASSRLQPFIRLRPDKSAAAGCCRLIHRRFPSSPAVSCGGTSRGMQSQIVCHGCRNILLYPRGAPTVCCAVCHAVNSAAPPPGMDIAHLICGGCRTLLMYTRNATSVRCSCCDTVNLIRPVSSIAHVNCGQCQTVLMYPYGAPSVKCAICNFITNIRVCQFLSLLSLLETL